MGQFRQMLFVLVTMMISLAHACLEEERIALLQLKHSLNFPNGTDSLPSSWGSTETHDCCDWEGITCNDTTRRVTELNLGFARDEKLGDWYLNASLFLPFQQLNALYLYNNRIAGCVENEGFERLSKLGNLEFLDLRGNKFNNISILISSLSALSSLRSLDLAYNQFKGSVNIEEMESLGNLEELDLSGNEISGFVGSRGSGLRQLSILWLNSITRYGRSVDQYLLQSLGTFPNLTTLYLRFNDFKGTIFREAESHNLMSTVEELYMDYSSVDENSLQSFGALLPSLKYLSLQSLNGTLTGKGLPNLKNLQDLDLSGSTLNNSFLQTIGTIPSLNTLTLSYCGLSGTIPTTAQGLCELRHLQELDMSNNDLSGNLPLCLENLTSLRVLDLSFNHLQIPLSLSPFFNLSKLEYLYGQNNEVLTEEEAHNLTPKFQLQTLYLNGRVQYHGGAFPKFLHHQHNLQDVDLSNLKIKGEFPDWLLENNTNLYSLSLANNSISGQFRLPSHSHMILSDLDISKNNIQGNIPAEIGVYLPGLTYLSMHGNGLAGSIPPSFGNMSSLAILDLSNNKFIEGLPDSLFHCINLAMLVVRNNSLSGRILGWTGNMSSLAFLDLSQNSFSGILPSTFSSSARLLYVNLSKNKLQGSIAGAFYGCSNLLALDLSHNSFTGSIPEWIDKLSQLSFLLLSYNNLEGEIPIQLCKLDQLSLIDLSHNRLSGHILPCLRSSSDYNGIEKGVSDNNRIFFEYLQSFEFIMKFIMKGVILSYQGSILKYISGIDLSCNSLIGTIPPGFGNLDKIKVLNLSYNGLTGPIPPTFSNLKEIESLDLSYNMLDGKIPPQITQLKFIEVFSVAHNNLSGKTPERVAQFATFEESSYKDNPFLCGLPLPKPCGESTSPAPTPTSLKNEAHSDFMDMEVFYVTFAVTYVMVLLGIGAVLYINPHWRRVWFYLIEVSINKCYYFLVDNLPFLSKFRFSKPCFS